MNALVLWTVQNTHTQRVLHNVHSLHYYKRKYKSDLQLNNGEG